MRSSGATYFGIGLVGYLLDECRDGLFGGAVVPRGQWLLGFCPGGATDNERQHGEG